MPVRVMMSVLAAAAGLAAALAVPVLADQPSPAASATQPFYRNCDEARAAGAAPIRRGEPGYRPALDRDNDGVACEDGSDPGPGSPSPTPTRSPSPTPRPSPTPTTTSVPRPGSDDRGADEDKERQAPVPKPVEADLPVTH